MRIIKEDLQAILTEPLTIEVAANDNQSNQWLPLLQHRGNQFDFNQNGHAMQIIGPVSEEFQQMMQREQLRHSRLAHLTVEDLLILRHDTIKTTNIKLRSTNSGDFQLDVSTKYANPITNSALNIFKHDEPRVNGNFVQFDLETINQLFNYLLVTSSKNEAILSLDENWSQVKSVIDSHRQPVQVPSEPAKAETKERMTRAGYQAKLSNNE